MALSGVHIACGFVSVFNGTALMSILSWSETMAAAGTSARAASSPARTSGAFTGSLLGFEVSASADAWVAWGSAPDASQASGSGNSGRILVRAGETRNIFCFDGDKLAWVAA